MSHSLIAVEHTAEVAHRLSLTPGKCQRIHGHGLRIRLELSGKLNPEGLVCGYDFGTVKGFFRRYVDEMIDHRTLLHKDDPFAGDLWLRDDREYTHLPGVRKCVSDPTSENIARWLAQWSVLVYGHPDLESVRVTVHETSVNSAEYAIDCAEDDGGGFRETISFPTIFGELQ